MNDTNSKPILVIGAGISGVTAALEAAEAGREVVLVEREPSIGGRVMRNYHYFPKLCPPSCGMEINTRRLERNPRVRVLTHAHVKAAAFRDGTWSVTVAKAPAYVNDRCTACGECAKVCQSKTADPFNLGISEMPAIHLPHPDCWPRKYVLDRKACSDEDLQSIVKACQYKAIDLEASEENEELTVGAIIVATGWKPYPLTNLKEFGGGAFKDVIANVHMERMVASTGPTEGKILRPSNGEAPKKVAFVQCAGSRDVNHLTYCSGVCCLASLKQAIYVRERLPEAEVTIYYIDRRAPGRNEDVLTRVADMEGVTMRKGKVGEITEKGDNSLVLRVEDVERGKIVEAEADLVVLATGMMPNASKEELPFELKRDDDGFGLDMPDHNLFVAGVARRPEEVASSTRDATGAAAKAYIAAGRGV